MSQVKLKRVPVELKRAPVNMLYTTKSALRVVDFAPLYAQLPHSSPTTRCLSKRTESVIDASSPSISPKLAISDK